MDKKLWKTRKSSKSLMQPKTGARHGFSLLYRLRASPIHTHPLAHCLPVVLCLLLVVVKAAGCVVCLVVVAVVWWHEECICNLSPSCHAHGHGCVCCFGVTSHSGLCFPDRLILVIYVVVAHLTSTAPKRLNSSKIPAFRSPSMFCTSTFRHPVSTMSPVQPSKTCWKGSWSSHDVLPDSITFRISVWGNAERRNENTQQCSVLVLQDRLRHHSVIILGTINSGLTKHRRYLIFFCGWTLKTSSSNSGGEKKKRVCNKTPTKQASKYARLTWHAGETKLKRFKTSQQSH